MSNYSNENSNYNLKDCRITEIVRASMKKLKNPEELLKTLRNVKNIYKIQVCLL